MPKAAVNKNHLMVSWQNDVGVAGQITLMEPKPEATAMENGADADFGPSVATANTSHIAAASFVRDPVSHETSMLSLG